MSGKERERDRIAWKFWPSFVLYCTIPSSMSGKYREARGVVSLNGGVFFLFLFVLCTVMHLMDSEYRC